MADTLEQKALRQPFRFGLMLGALALPTAWVASADILRLATGYRLLNAEEVTGYFVSGALSGMILGSGAVRAWAAWRNREVDQARWLLIGHGGLVALFAGVLLAQNLQRQYAIFQLILPSPPNFLAHEMPMWFYYLLHVANAFPLQVALLMLLLGIFMRSPRAGK